LGSVYESLLELQPVITQQGRRPVFRMEEHGEERRSTGSHYTPPELVTPLIEHALEPVLQERLAKAATRDEKEAAILGMKVLDPACGSGHFLLAAARRLGKELARVRTGEDEPAPEAIQAGVRDVIAHSIYGVDRNPLAVELARVALWLEGHAAGKPLTFLAHHIRHGDSLVGIVDVQALEDGIPDEAFQPVHGDDRRTANRIKRLNAKDRNDALLRHAFATQTLESFSRTLAQVDDMPEETLADVRAKEAAWRKLQTNDEWQRLQQAADLWTAAFFQSYTAETPDAAFITTYSVHQTLSDKGRLDPRQAGRALELRQALAFFHWPLEFAEVFGSGGFDVVLGNPPFMGGLKISGNFGDVYRKWLECILPPFAGRADLCAAFFRRAFHLLRPGGRLGMIATNTLGQGDTRQSGLAVILQQGGAIHFAQRFVKWPGQANVE
ncbi:hypothetical protein RY27_06820, partial [Litorilinea aerophila]